MLQGYVVTVREQGSLSFQKGRPECPAPDRSLSRIPTRRSPRDETFGCLASAASVSFAFIPRVVQRVYVLLKPSYNMMFVTRAGGRHTLGLVSQPRSGRLPGLLGPSGNGVLPVGIGPVCI